ncbi:cation diffusion facilitator family transporter [Nodosilinea sp. PGN35]|uniref:cation diffusion facilitator family transporter n=1 Tax=Nodosilinea sp. PGN35 TaxID=3020489 RepID=UPI0023B2560D|nr:cation diffusion facilitator family transporter [Nodosilinea sp. TSF1-S3]MDF0369982.1 cation diffusion facilitator family transporter [Nodosilinea sp. TSF1-S3]
MPNPDAIEESLREAIPGEIALMTTVEPDHPHSYGHAHGHEHHHGPGHAYGHGHTHGAVDPEIAASERGLWAVKWSFVGLALTAVAQAVVFALSGSVALMADLIHNVGDAMTSVPLGVAFLLARAKPSPRFAYGYGRSEDLAGVAIVAVIFVSALVTGYESLERLSQPQPLDHLGALAAAAVIGFIGNEVVALFRLRVGREINSAALVADGLHARADGLVSLAVLVSAVGVGLGFPWADPAMGLVITLVLLRVVWQSTQTVFTRLLDGVEPEMLDRLRHEVDHGVEDAAAAVTAVKARWLGHRLYGEVSLAVEPGLSVAAGEAIASRLRTHLHQQLPYLAEVTIQVQPRQLTPLD